MKEIRNEINKLLEDRFNRVGIDYVVLESSEEYKGAISHKNAVIEFFNVINKRYKEYELSYDIDESKMTSEYIDKEELMELPDESFFNKEKSYTVDNPVPYWYAFLASPHGANYTKEDFIDFNKHIIEDNAEIYRWNDNFSNYFDEGKEWWGTGLWSIYNPSKNIFVVIGASLTD